MRTNALLALVVAAGFGAATVSAGAQTTTPQQPASTPAPGQPNAQSQGPSAQTQPQNAPPPGAPIPPAGPSSITVPGPPAPPLPTTDEEFVRMAAMSSNAEVMEARLAARRTKSPLVQQFAQHMIDDHTTANVELDAAARKATHRYRVPGRAEMPASVAEYRALEQAQGVDFDRMYMADQIPDHTAAVNAFQWEVDNGKDPVIKDFATRTLPAVKAHLAMAQAFVASNGTSLTVDAGGLAVGAGGANPSTAAQPVRAPISAPANNAATTTNGQTNGTNSVNATIPVHASPAPTAAPK